MTMFIWTCNAVGQEHSSQKNLSESGDERHKRRRGGQKISWVRCITSDLGSIGLEFKGAEEEV